MEGTLILDKPSGPTSHDVVYQVRRACGLRRVGHAGTLDPLATGVLVVCLGRVTRLIEYMMGHDKVYEGIVRLGASTNTYDLEGEITTSRPVPELTLAQLDSALDQFRGPIEQIPPLYSAIKKDGQPLYKLARAGKKVDIPPRSVTIHALEIVRWTSPDLHLRVHSSSGTYIRSLAHDIGEALGCGGHLAFLRRTAVGPFTLDQALPLAELAAETAADHLLSAGETIPHIPQFVAEESQIQALLNGRHVEGSLDTDEATRRQLVDAAGTFFGVIRWEDGKWRPEKMFP